MTTAESLKDAFHHPPHSEGQFTLLKIELDGLNFRVSIPANITSDRS
jgi:hypothetical protein